MTFKVVAAVAELANILKAASSNHSSSSISVLGLNGIRSKWFFHLAIVQVALLGLSFAVNARHDFQRVRTLCQPNMCPPQKEICYPFFFSALLLSGSSWDQRRGGRTRGVDGRTSSKAWEVREALNPLEATVGRMKV